VYSPLASHCFLVSRFGIRFRAVQFHQGNKKPASGGFSFQPEDTSADYLFMTYIVTSKPKRISVAAGLVHMMISFWLLSAS
jgi:hypothetical protein